MDSQYHLGSAAEAHRKLDRLSSYDDRKELDLKGSCASSEIQCRHERCSNLTGLKSPKILVPDRLCSCRLQTRIVSCLKHSGLQNASSDCKPHLVKELEVGSEILGEKSSCSVGKELISTPISKDTFILSQRFLLNQSLNDRIKKPVLRSSKKCFLCSRSYLKEWKISGSTQDFVLNNFLNKVSLFAGKNSARVEISSDLEQFLRSHIFSPDEFVYKVYSVLHTNGDPRLAILTNHALYLVSSGECRCSLKLCCTISYKKLKAVIISPFSQFLTLISTTSRTFCVINTSVHYGIAQEITTSLAFMVHKLNMQNKLDCYLNAVEINETDGLDSFLEPLPRGIFQNGEDILFQSWVWLQEERIDAPSLAHCKEGHLMYKSCNCNSWNVCYVRLKNGVLYVSDNMSQRVPQFSVSLCSDYCATCRAVACHDRPYTFELRSTDGLCYLFAAADNAELTDWLHCIVSAISKADMFSMTDEELSVKGYFVLLSNVQLVLYHFLNKVFTQCPLDNIASFRHSQIKQDLFFVLEFGCREASECDGDWIFHFVSERTFCQFHTVLRNLRPSLFTEDAKSAITRNEYVLNRCRRVNSSVRSLWDNFVTKSSTR